MPTTTAQVVWSGRRGALAPGRDRIEGEAFAIVLGQDVHGAALVPERELREREQIAPGRQSEQTALDPLQSRAIHARITKDRADVVETGSDGALALGGEIRASRGRARFDAEAPSRPRAAEPALSRRAASSPSRDGAASRRPGS